MVGNNAYSLGDILAFAVLFARNFLDFSYNRSKKIGFVHGLFALNYAESTFQSHTGVDVFLFERFVFAVGGFIELHKHVVPDFEIFAAIASGRTMLAAFGLTVVYKHFGIGTARTGNACGSPPVVFLWKEENVIASDSRLFPQFRSFGVAGAVVVAGKHRHGKARRIYSEIFGRG